jgi:ribosomal protein S18 acetylase RimI-like enzyme
MPVPPVPPLPDPPVHSGITWRPLRPDDAGRAAAFFDDCFDVDGGYRMVASEFTTEFEDSDSDLAHDSLVAVAEDGRIAAFAFVQVPGGDETEHRCFPWGRVHPEYRDRGLGSFILGWMEARCRQRLAEKDPALPKVIRTSAYDTQTDRIAFYELAGYRPVRYFVEMIRDLAPGLPAAPVPPGIDLVPLTEDLLETARLVHNESFADHWGSQPMNENSWQVFVGSEFLLADASFLAYDGDVPIGFLTSFMYPHDFADRGRTEAWIEGVGTIGSRRRRGVASVLLTRAMEAFVERDLEFAALGVDTDNPTGALGLYERLGFVVEKRHMVLAKPAS